MPMLGFKLSWAPSANLLGLKYLTKSYIYIYKDNNLSYISYKVTYIEPYKTHEILMHP